MSINFTSNLSDFIGKLGYDTIDWADLIPLDNHTISGVDSNNRGKSKGGIGYSFDHPLSCKRQTQGATSTWPGNFDPTEPALLCPLTGLGSTSLGPIRITFDDPVHGVGARIQQRFSISKPDASFDAFIQVFDSVKTPLHEPVKFKCPETPDNATFIGLLDDPGVAARIKYVEFDTRASDSDDDGDFAIDMLRLIS